MFVGIEIRKDNESGEWDFKGKVGNREVMVYI